MHGPDADRRATRVTLCRPSIAITENFANGANLAEFVAELKLRPKRPATLGRFPSAASTCAAAIRRSEKIRQMAAGALANNGVVRYSAAVAEPLITSSALVQLFVFDRCEGGGETADGRAGDFPSSAESVSAVVAAAVAALLEETAVVVSVGCDAKATRVRETFDVSAAGGEGGGDDGGGGGGGSGGGGRSVVLRAATLQGTMFKYKPPEGLITSADVVKRWVGEIVGSTAKPYLTGADRAVLMAMMRTRSRGDL